MSHYQFRADAVAAPGGNLLFLFHGTGGDENQFFELAGQVLPGAKRIAPRGDVSENGALRYFRRTAEGVYDMDDLAIRTRAMADFIAKKIKEYQPDRVLSLGYSNGANILASVMFEAPKLFDDAVLMHPLIPFKPVPQRFEDTRVLITAGRRDPIAPAHATQALADYFETGGGQVTLAWHDGGHEIRQDEIEAIRDFL